MDKAELYSRVSLDLEHENVQIDKTSWWAADSAKRRRSTQSEPLIASAASAEAAGASDGAGGIGARGREWKFYRSPLTIVFTKSLRPNIELILEHQAKWQTVIQDLRSSRGLDSDAHAEGS